MLSAKPYAKTARIQLNLGRNDFTHRRSIKMRELNNFNSSNPLPCHTIPLILSAGSAVMIFHLHVNHFNDSYSDHVQLIDDRRPADEALCEGISSSPTLTKGDQYRPPFAFLICCPDPEFSLSCHRCSGIF